MPKLWHNVSQTVGETYLSVKWLATWKQFHNRGGYTSITFKRCNPFQILYPTIIDAFRHLRWKLIKLKVEHNVNQIDFVPSKRNYHRLGEVIYLYKLITEGYRYLNDNELATKGNDTWSCFISYQLVLLLLTMHLKNFVKILISLRI